MKTRTVGGLVMIALAVACAIVCWFKLPDTVVMQITTNGTTQNTMPKLFAILLPLVLTISGSIGVIRAKLPTNRYRCLGVAVVGLVLPIITLLINR